LLDLAINYSKVIAKDPTTP